MIMVTQHTEPDKKVQGIEMLVRLLKKRHVLCIRAYRVGAVADTGSFDIAAHAMVVTFGSLPTAEGTRGAPIATVAACRLGCIALAVCHL